MSPRGSWPRGGVRTRLPVVFRKSGAEFTPRDITGLALWLDASDASTLFQDAAATTPATATSDPVGAWLDKSGNARHATQSTAGSRPVVGSIASGRGLVFDSNDSLLSLASIADIIGAPASSPATTIAFIALNSSGAAGFTMGANDAANGRLLVSNSFDAAGASFFDVAGASGGRLSYTLPASSQTTASVYIMQRNGASMIVRRNGATIAAKADASQTYSATTARLSIGQAIGLSGFAGTCASVLCYPSALAATQYQRIERYLANRWGITLAPQVPNADAQNWIDRVYANGGTVSSSTAASVNQLCDSLDSASLRDRFYRLNLFCGSNLNAALVPLYRGPSLSGTQYGNATDTNVGGLFVSGDYSETGASGGLNSGASNSSKYLRTGIAPSDMSAVCTNVHASVYSRAVMSSNSQAIGAVAFSFFPAYGGNRVFFRTNGNNSGLEGTITTTSGHILAVRTGATAADLYRNGSSQGGTPADNGTTASETSKLLVFGTGAAENASVFFPGTLQMYSLGLGMTAPQAAAFYSAVQAFQTSLTRNL